MGDPPFFSSLSFLVQQCEVANVVLAARPNKKSWSACPYHIVSLSCFFFRVLFFHA